MTSDSQAPTTREAEEVPAAASPGLRIGTVRDGVVASIRDAILCGEVAPGDRLPSERAIAQQFGVGRGSVREALKQLDQLGLVEIRHGGGARVKPLEDASLDVLRHLLALEGGPGVELVVQLLEVNELMMVGAVALAVRNATDEELERAVALLDGLADERVDTDVYLAWLDELTQLISTASRNLVLRLVRNGLRSVFSETPGGRAAPHSRRPSISIVAPLARRISAALAERDASGAQEGVRLLLRAHREQLLKRLELRESVVGERAAYAAPNATHNTFTDPSPAGRSQP
jgi:GntR family transcriptional repressor for pyruvate dehydrogenase complex